MMNRIKNELNHLQNDTKEFGKLITRHQNIVLKRFYTEGGHEARKPVKVCVTDARQHYQARKNAVWFETVVVPVMRQTEVAV